MFPSIISLIVIITHYMIWDMYVKLSFLTLNMSLHSGHPGQILLDVDQPQDANPLPVDIQLPIRPVRGPGTWGGCGSRGPRGSRGGRGAGVVRGPPGRPPKPRPLVPSSSRRGARGGSLARNSQPVAGGSQSQGGSSQPVAGGSQSQGGSSQPVAGGSQSQRRKFSTCCRRIATTFGKFLT